MDVFISWSGPRSGAVAEALKNWLPQIINALKPWLSSTDIDKGARWGVDVATKLEISKAGIICLTPGNLRSEWILFEAGALSKTLQNTFVCPLLISMEPADVKGPLAQFQATRATRDDVHKLLKTLNAGLEDATRRSDAQIDESFEVWWPKLEASLKALPPDDVTARPTRTERELLEEILDYVRNQNRVSVQALSEDDRAQIISGRVWNALRETRILVRSTSITKKSPEVEISVEHGKKSKSSIIVKSETPLDQVDAIIGAQVASLDRNDTREE
jgi:hypothetical protein